jgi:hypothetical protein
VLTTDTRFLPARLASSSVRSALRNSVSIPDVLTDASATPMLIVRSASGRPQKESRCGRGTAPWPFKLPSDDTKLIRPAPFAIAAGNLREYVAAFALEPAGTIPRACRLRFRLSKKGACHARTPFAGCPYSHCFCAQCAGSTRPRWRGWWGSSRRRSCRCRFRWSCGDNQPGNRTLVRYWRNNRSRRRAAIIDGQRGSRQPHPRRYGTSAGAHPWAISTSTPAHNVPVTGAPAGVPRATPTRPPSGQATLPTNPPAAGNAPATSGRGGGGTRSGSDRPVGGQDVSGTPRIMNDPSLGPIR